MSENGEEKPKSIKLEVELQADGNLSVKCPMLGDTLFMLGLLEMCKATVFQFKANQTSNSGIIKPKGGIMDFARKRFK